MNGSIQDGLGYKMGMSKYFELAGQILSSGNDNSDYRAATINLFGDEADNCYNNLYCFARDAMPDEIVQCIMGSYYLGYFVHQLYIEDLNKT